jgi:hypothetical protein
MCLYSSLPHPLFMLLRLCASLLVIFTGDDTIDPRSVNYSVKLRRRIRHGWRRLRGHLRRGEGHITGNMKRTKLLLETPSDKFYKDLRTYKKSSGPRPYFTTAGRTCCARSSIEFSVTINYLDNYINKQTKKTAKPKTSSRGRPRKIVILAIPENTTATILQPTCSPISRLSITLTPAQRTPFQRIRVDSNTSETVE